MKGSTEDINLDYFRTEFIGRNIGVPVEFIAYENRPLWTFETALSISILHGILPRPNNIDHPLDLMSDVWKIFDAFPIDKSEWKPYWNNNVESSHEKVKVSYYKYTTLTGEIQLLAFVVNISSEPVDEVSIDFNERVTSGTDLLSDKNVGFSFELPPYGHRILYVK